MNSLKHIIGYGVVLILLGLAVRTAVNEHIAHVVAQKDFEAQTKVQQALDKAQQDFDTKLDARIKALTPQNALPVLQSELQKGQVGKKSPLKPIREVPVSSLPPEVSKDLPDAPGAKVALLDPLQQQALASDLLICDKAKGDLSDCGEKLKAKDQQIKDLQTELKGGTWFGRFKKETKCLAFSGLGAGIGSLAGGKHPVYGAMGGAVVGEASCKIFF